MDRVSQQDYMEKLCALGLGAANALLGPLVVQLRRYCVSGDSNENPGDLTRLIVETENSLEFIFVNPFDAVAPMKSKQRERLFIEAVVWNLKTAYVREGGEGAEQRYMDYVTHTLEQVYGVDHVREAFEKYEIHQKFKRAPISKIDLRRSLFARVRPNRQTPPAPSYRFQQLRPIPGHFPIAVKQNATGDAANLYRSAKEACRQEAEANVSVNVGENSDVEVIEDSSDQGEDSDGAVTPSEDLLELQKNRGENPDGQTDTSILHDLANVTEPCPRDDSGNQRPSSNGSEALKDAMNELETAIFNLDKQRDVVAEDLRTELGEKDSNLPDTANETCFKDDMELEYDPTVRLQTMRQKVQAPKRKQDGTVIFQPPSFDDEVAQMLDCMHKVHELKDLHTALGKVATVAQRCVNIVAPIPRAERISCIPSSQLVKPTELCLVKAEALKAQQGLSQFFQAIEATNHYFKSAIDKTVPAEMSRSCILDLISHIFRRKGFFDEGFTNAKTFFLGLTEVVSILQKKKRGSPEGEVSIQAYLDSLFMLRTTILTMKDIVRVSMTQDATESNFNSLCHMLNE